MIINILRKNPKVKAIIKLIYGFTGDLIYKLFFSVKNNSFLTEKLFTDKNAFFGYYDKSPVNDSKSHIIAHTTNQNTNVDYESVNSVNITLKDINSGIEETIDNTKAFNWQIGSRLQWINNKNFIYNTIVRGKIFSRIYNIENKKFKNLPLPIFDCYRDLFGIGLSFMQLYLNHKEYGYNLKNFSEGGFIKDCIYRIDFNDKKIKIIVTIDQVNNLLNKNIKDGSFNHVMISPNGDKFIFIYRYFDKNQLRKDYLFLYDFKIKKLSCLLDTGYVSHMNWFNNSSLIGYYRNRFGNDSLNLIKIRGGSFHEEILLKDINDGHPVKFDENHIVFDSYPNFFRLKSIYKINIRDKKLKRICEMYESFKFRGSFRCDLHPRISENVIYIDSVHEGERNIYRIDINI